MASINKWEYTARKLVMIRRWLDEHPNGLVPTGRWTDPTLNRKQWLRWFDECLAAKINSKIPGFGVGRKWQPEYQLELLRLRHYIGNNIIMDGVSYILGARIRESLQHRLRCRED